MCRLIYDVNTFMNMMIHAIAKSSADIQILYNNIYEYIESEIRFEHVEYSSRDIFNIVVYSAASHLEDTYTPKVFCDSHTVIEEYLLGVADVMLTYGYAEFDNIIELIHNFS